MIRVLIGYDGSPRSDRAIQVAGRLLEGGHAVVLHVGDARYSGVVPGPAPAPPVPSVPVTALDAHAETAAERAAREVAELGVREAEDAGFRATPATALSTGAAGIADAIVRAADEHAADLIVVGSRGRSGLKAVLLGSVSNGVAHRADRPVLIVPDGDGS